MNSSAAGKRYKTCVTYWAFIGASNGRKNVYDAVRETSEAGFDGIELSLSHKGQISLNTSYKEAEEIGCFANNHGVEIPSISTLLLYETKLLSSNKEERQDAKTIVSSMIRLAEVLGSRSVSFPLVGNLEMLTYLDEMISDVLAGTSRETLLCIEKVRNDFFKAPEDLSRVLEIFSPEQVGFCLDTGNVLPQSTPEEWIRHFSGRIGKVHFTDFIPGSDGKGRSVDIGEGEIYWPDVLQALESSGYSGYLTVEAFPRPRERDRIRLRRLARNIKAILNKGDE